MNNLTQPGKLFQKKIPEKSQKQIPRIGRTRTILTPAGEIPSDPAEAAAAQKAIKARKQTLDAGAIDLDFKKKLFEMEMTSFQIQHEKALQWNFPLVV
jgi:hypothetical protein